MGNSSMPPATPKAIQTNNIKDHEERTSITEKINLTKKQHQVLNIICNTCEALLGKISSDDKTDNNSSQSTSDSLTLDFMNCDQDLLKRLQTQV
jgi:peptide methionine sulfoxide reductase MsrB